LGLGLGRDGLQYSIDPFALQILNLQETDLIIILDELSEKIHETELTIGP